MRPAIQQAARRVLDGSTGDRLLALVAAVVDVALFHPASWLLVLAGVLSVLDWLAGRERAKAEGVYSPRAAKAGLNSKALSWVLLLVIWVLTIVLLKLGEELAVDLAVTWVLPIFFTLKFMLEELHSLYDSLGQPRWLAPLIDFLEGITRHLAPGRRE